ncbi:high-temperature-induced dauer-formation protein-domain-containing protein [Lentinula aciculospora]|uniref:High-temperature-induced dauer-formation protein-domain-containing protein n=1 Tax=Lentinula aciculospora TaxID=153920 RepID=A0A9W9DWE0_9AGAR|nr:high-temperature-induced dauer-formation protein-domain-containing protein [Lentinula aciculospora]
MFSKIPQRLTAPLGLLSDSEKLAFRSQAGGLQKLAAVRNIAETDNYWNQYVILFDSASEVFSLITPNDIRRALLDAPENVATLIRVMCLRLFNLISDHTFPAPSSASVSALATTFIKAGTGAAERNTTKEVLNCMRVLQRVLPVVFEKEGGESSSFEVDVFWKRVEIDDTEEEEPIPPTEAPQFVIEDDEDSEDEAKSSGLQSSTIPTLKPKKQLPSLGERLFSSIVDLLFCCGFTLPMQIQKDHYKINYVIWEKGIGSTIDPGPSHQYDSNKAEVLRLLLVLLSRQIYVSASSIFTKPSTYTLHLVQKLPRRDVLTILCSLLNTAMNSPQAQPITINSMAGRLPYNHLVFKGENPRVNLVAICFEALVVLLDFQSGSARDVMVGTNEQQTSAPTSRTNAFRYFLMKLHRTQDFQFVLSGIFGIMEQEVVNMNNILPGARKSTPYIAENIVFFWKMIELNKRFRAYVLDSDQGMGLIAYLVCYNLEIKDKPQQHGICRALSYIVQTLSAEPAFGQRLSNPIKTSLPSKFPACGTTADFLINAIYSIVATTSGQLNSLYPALIIALSNCAPYFKNLSITSSTRLVQLFTSFSNPLFLLSDEGHPRLLFFMLEMFNSVILHHLSENPNLIHGILAAHKTFEDLGTFTLARGLREIRRVQHAKEDQARKLSLDDRRKSRKVTKEENTSEEKKNLLNKEEEDDNNESSVATEIPHADMDVGPTTTAEPIVSPTSESISSAKPSEKAKGKMKQRRSSSSLDAGSLERIAAAGIGRNGFVPTPEWVASWQQGLPLDTVMLMISELLPKVQEMQSSHKASSASTILDFLGSVTLADVLPPAPPLSPRRFVWSDASIVWLTSLIWGEVFVRGMSPLGVWNSTSIRLFHVKHSQNQQRQITETVSNVVGGLLGRTNSETSISRTRS